MRTFKLLVAYDGTSFVGWQRQSAGVSVQGLIESALATLAGEPVAIVGAWRTDAGVHATGQVASVRFNTRLAPLELRRAINAHLPAEVRVLNAEEAEEAFHARFHARTKTYEYRILEGPLASPFSHRFAWHVDGPLHVRHMSEAARMIEGRHDFACFQSAGGGVRTTIRHVIHSDLTTAGGGGRFPFAPEPFLPEGRLILYRITGDGFLRHMVRAIVGTLVEIGRQAADVALVAQLLTGAERASAGPTAPARGLCLCGVSYAETPAEVATQR
jgi:tRNA pseudouridine38-40 synthase